MIKFKIFIPYLLEVLAYAPTLQGNLNFGLNRIVILKLLTLGWIFGGFLLVKILNSKKIWTKIIYFIFILNVIYQLSSIFLQPILKKSFSSPQYVIQYIAENLNFVGNYFVVVFVLINGLRTILNFLKRKNLTLNSKNLSFLFGFVCLFQLYPQWDPMHIWWISPLLFIASLNKTSTLFTKPVFLILLICALFQSIYDFSQERYDYQNEILFGMRSNYVYASYVDQTMIQLEKIMRKRRMHFECSNALYSSAGGIYGEATHSYVNWGRKTVNETRYEIIFYCGLNQDDFERKKRIYGNPIFKVDFPDGTWNGAFYLI